ncbi:putative bifunctional diguanylate cyclase/phosphodiesterase [Modestobacter sp. VKM Ac-2985]|uniref:putative bifunctional diguanylate cyclase/phosphodiesterase n=1 Tax=Modestobacter sp. VKM Ac-2985 TaxID=3004139 RepID=UPI0022AB5200|nr:bifunctional diguanylate cyclase/phosphodiesterase [Modestobacter sp. VKM Ac-2985]MCZ2839403.1 bifunctional diguanylate cyclase/phosphodiesterase [Modestobacter sp. VKM Ac-2985]
MAQSWLTGAAATGPLPPTGEGVPGELRREVLRDAGVVVALTLGCLAAGVVWDLPQRIAGWSLATGAPVDHVVFLLAASHLLMMGFGARRGRQLKTEAAEHRRLEVLLRDQADRDPLTGLATFAAFLTALHRLERSGTAADDVVVLLLDVDRFTAVNDTLGHEVGSGLLVALADRIRAVLPAGGVAARTGGDVFALLVPDASTALATHVVAALRRPFTVGELELEVDLSAGLARGLAPGGADLVRRADVARSTAKRQSAGLVVYSPDLDTFDPGQLALHGDLRRAIREGTLEVHHQPKVCLTDGRVVGVEALVRWPHPQLGLLMPDRFIVLAEQTGLIAPLTDLVLRRALADARGWREAGRRLTVAVNLSARLLHDPQLPARVSAALRAERVAPEDLELEITETAAMEDPERAMTVLGQLRLLGVRLSVDDFGTGHASLAHLSRLPVDVLKVDRSFVAGLDTEPAARAIVRSTIDLGHALGLSVVAEGVETVEQWHQLAAWGCDLAQGWWLARPVPAAVVPAVAAEIEQRCARLEPPAAVDVASVVPAQRSFG